MKQQTTTSNNGQTAVKTTKTTKKGLKPKDRKLAVRTGKKMTGNQWQNTPQQHMFMQAWLDPKSTTFGNAYQSALVAGYSSYYAVQLSSPAVNNLWLKDYTRKLLLSDEHLKAILQQLAMSANNSKSPDDTRVKSIELLLRVSGALDNKNSVTVNVVQPILGGASVPKHVDSTQS